MSKNIIRTLGLAAFLCIGALPVAAQEKQVPKKFTSKTGVRTIIQSDSNSDTVAICLFVRAGAAEEGGLAGMGAFTSRAIFGSNQQQSSDAVRRNIYAAGGSLESRWTPDYTLFTCVTTKAGFRDAMYLLSTAVKSADFDSESMKRAREEVLDQGAKDSADPFQIGYSALRTRLYAEGPYRQSFAPTMDELRRLNPVNVRSYYQRRYTPENTVISVVGNIPTETVERTVENLFVDYDRQPGRAPQPIPEQYGEGSRVTRPASTSTTLLLAGYRAPAIDSPDYPAALVLSALLGGGKSSRLFHQVRDVGGVGYSVGTYFPALAHAGHIVAYTEYDPARDAKKEDSSGKPDSAAEKLLLEAVQSIATNPPAAKEVDRAKRYAAGSYALGHQRTRDRAFHLGWYETIGVGFTFDSELTKRIEAVTAEDVQRVSKKCLVSPVMVVVRPLLLP